MVNRRTGTFSMEVKKTVDRGVRLQIKMFSVFLSDQVVPCLVSRLKKAISSALHFLFFSFRDVSWRCTMTITTLTSKGHHSGGRKSFITFLKRLSVKFMSRLQLNVDSLFGCLCLCLQCRSGSLQRSWKILLQRKCVSWSRYATSTLSSTLLTKAWIDWDACHSDLPVWGGIVSVPGRHCWSVTDLCFSGLRDLEQPDVALADEW